MTLHNYLRKQMGTQSANLDSRIIRQKAFRIKYEKENEELLLHLPYCYPILQDLR